MQRRDFFPHWSEGAFSFLCTYIPLDWQIPHFLPPGQAGRQTTNRAEPTRFWFDLVYTYVVYKKRLTQIFPLKMYTKESILEGGRPLSAVDIVLSRIVIYWSSGWCRGRRISFQFRPCYTKDTKQRLRFSMVLRNRFFFLVRKTGSSWYLFHLYLIAKSVRFNCSEMIWDLHRPDSWYMGNLPFSWVYYSYVQLDESLFSR